jgi:hypothetical protein
MTKKKDETTTEVIAPKRRAPYRPRVHPTPGIVIPDDTLLKAEQVAQMIAPAYPISGLQAVIGAVAFAHATIVELLKQQQVTE